MTLHHGPNTPTERDALPRAINAYLSAHAAGNDGLALSAFTADAVVTDEGRNHVGHAEIECWLRRSANEYTYTTEFRSAVKADETVDVVQHLEGDFPGGVADLHFRFHMEDALITRLVIEP